VRDAEQPRALHFLWCGVAQDLAALEQTLAAGQVAGVPAHGAAEPGPRGLAVPVPALDDAALGALQDEGPSGTQARAGLVCELRALAGAAATLSDQLSLRHFSHIRTGVQVLAT
jgi:hypothetical protein